MTLAQCKLINMNRDGLEKRRWDQPAASGRSRAALTIRGLEETRGLFLEGEAE